MRAAVKLQNGFNYSERVYSVDAQLKAVRIYETGECTWVGSESVDGDIEISIPDGAIALVRVGVSERGVSTPELVWGELDMRAGLPDQLQYSGKFLWYVECGQHTKEPIVITTIGQYIQAQIEDKIREFNSPEWVEVPYVWGHQAAACFWRLVEGEFQAVSGEGDATPYLKANGEFSCAQFDREDELDRYETSCDSGKRFQDGAVFAHLESSFQFSNNPLPSLRKRFGGEWKYYDATKEPFENWKGSGEPMMFLGDDWFVTYKPD